MKNLENLGVQEIENCNEKLINGGSWLGEAIGTLVGAMVRYNPVTGGTNVCADVAYYMSK